MVHQFILDVCEFLKIKVPHVSFDTSRFPTETMLAQCSPSGDTIYIRGGYQDVNPDLFFAIAHELRHVWQIKNAEAFSLSTYQPIDLLHSVEEYNLQTAEIYANAFAAIIMVDYFGVKPLFNNLSETVKEQIFERMELIKNGL